MKDIDTEYHEMIIRRRNESMEDRASFYFNGRNWYTDDNWRNVEKNNFFKNVSPRQFCWEGNASHPKFWECGKCAELSTCELGKFRMAKAAKAEEEKKLQAERRKEKVKNFFEKVSDTFDKFFSN